MGDRRFDPRRLGQAGEDRAAAWYSEQGYTILERNWRRREGEVDVIAASGGTVVFAEVKTRTTDRYGTPFEAVDRPKQARIRRLAAIWLAENPGGRRTVRFDVVAVVGTRVDVRQGVF